MAGSVLYERAGLLICVKGIAFVVSRHMNEPKKIITKLLQGAINSLYSDIDVKIQLAHPNIMAHGDYASNIALQIAGKVKGNPREIAQKITDHLTHQDSLSTNVERVDVAGPGFINFTLSKEFFASNLNSIDDDFGKNKELDGKKAIVEYTDPNPFKVLHIGHLMSNTIGESISRIIEWSGAETVRACYQGDVGMHVAQAIWGLFDKGIDNLPKDKELSVQVEYLGQAYVHGSTAYTDGDEETKQAIKDLNKKIYEKSDKEVNDIYDWGRQISLDYFEIQYKKLGTYHNSKEDKAFDFYFFESEVGEHGKELVQEYLKKGVFVESDGAVIFEGEKYGLHTRVFLNSEGLPTYEAKELGLAQIKYDKFPYDLSVVITGNEINAYFEVLLKVMSLIYPDLREKTVHVGHGMLRLPSGKMSSRKGTVLSASELINYALEKVETREGQKNDENTNSNIAIGAIKFSILSQAAGGDIVFDYKKSLSFEGDSAPYLQYTYARSKSVLRKAKSKNLESSMSLPDEWTTTELERYLYRFPEAVERSLHEYSPHYIATYLIELARLFNSWYGNTKIIVEEDKSTGYKLALTEATATIIKNGLWLLGINVVDEM